MYSENHIPTVIASPIVGHAVRWCCVNVYPLWRTVWIFHHLPLSAPCSIVGVWCVMIVSETTQYRCCCCCCLSIENNNILNGILRGDLISCWHTLLFGFFFWFPVKWYNVMTQRTNTVGLDREMEDSLYCPYCLPTCSETQYTVTVMDLPLNKFNMKSFP